MMPGISVHALDVMTSGTWRFDNSSLHWRHQVHGSMATFDPFPAYAHDQAVVAETVAHVVRCQRPLWDIELYVANREEVGRTNGHSNIHESGHYDQDDKWVKDDPVGLILLSGKRIPPHPAMARYLVAHEYGHHIEWMLGHLRGAKSFWGDELVSEYSKVRGLPESAVHHGQGGNWHNAAAEIFACDFRILCCDVESEFWPHPGLPRPEELPALHDWWASAQADLNAATATS